MSQAPAPGAARRRWLVAAGAGLGVAGLALLAAAFWPAEEPYAEFVRPDGAFRVVVTRRPGWAAAMPGQSGDSPGTVALLDRQGRVLQRTPVDMVQRVDAVQWEPGRVSIKLIADWALPEGS